MRVVDGFNDLVLEPLAGVTGGATEGRDTVDDVDGEVEAVDLVEDGEFERGVDVALFRVAADVEVFVVGLLVGELVDERGIGVEVEDNGLIRGEEGLELALAEAMGMVGGGHETEEVDDVDEAQLKLRAVFAEDGGGGERLRGGDVAGAGDDGIGLLALVVRGEVPDADALGAVLDGLLHGEVLEVRGLIGDDDVDVVLAAEAVVANAQQAIRVGREIDAGDVGALVGDDVEEAGILVGEAVVVLPPDE